MSNATVIGTSFLNVCEPCTSLNIVCNKVINHSTGLSGKRAGEHMAVNTVYQFELGVPQGLPFSTNRGDLQIIENAMNNGSSFNYAPVANKNTGNVVLENANVFRIPIAFNFTKYQGDLTGDQLNQITPRDIVVAEEQIYVNTTAVTGSPSGNLVKAGDYIQLNSHPYQVTADVTYSSSSNITIPLNRKVMEANADISTFYIINDYGKSGLSGQRSPNWTVKFAELNPSTIQPHNRLTYRNATFKLIEVL